MAYTSVLPVHRLDRSIDYVKDRAKTTKSAGSLEEAIDYALNREKTEQTIFEDAMGCTCENAYVDMVKTKERFHKKDGVQGYHLVQSFAEGEVSPELAHLIGQELAEQLLKGQYEVVITTHLNTSHYHNHLVWNSVSMVDGKKYHSNAKSYFTEVRQISDQLCRKYGLSVIQTNQGKAMHYAQWKAEAEGKPTWRTAIRMDIQEAIGVSFSWSQFVKEMEKRGYAWKLNRKYPSLKTPGMERYIRLRSLGKDMEKQKSGRRFCAQRSGRCMETRRCNLRDGNSPDFRDCIILIYIRWGYFQRSPSGFPMQYVPISGGWTKGSAKWNFYKRKGSQPGKNWQHTGSPWKNRYFL